MTDKMTDEQIITALEHCTSSLSIEACDGCPMSKGVCDKDASALEKHALALIIRLKEANKHHEKAEEFAEKAFKLHEEETKLKEKEIEILIRKKEALRDEIAEKDAEIEKLNVELVGMRGACESYKIHYDNAQAEIERMKNAYKQCAWERDVLGKSEAYREVADKLKEKATGTFYEERKYVDTDDIDNILEELTRNLHDTCTESNE